MINRLTLSILISVCSCCAVWAHNRNVRHLTIDDGLSSNTIYSIIQDDLGRMWFGTNDGLHCYDGRNITVWRDPSMPSLGQVIYCMAENHDKQLWVGSDKGLSIFDLRKEKFIEPSQFYNDDVRIKSSVSDILFAKDGTAWIATTAQGVFRHDPKTGHTDHYAAIGRINSDIIHDLEEDSGGTIWAVSPEEGLSRFDKKHNLFMPVASSPRNTKSIFEDKAHNLWVGTTTGLCSFDRNSGVWETHISPSGNNVLQIRQIVEHDPGILILASDEGLTTYNTATGETTNIKASHTLPDNLNDNYLHSLFIDRENGLWIGTFFGGANYIPPSFRLFNHYFSGNSGLPARIISVFAKADNGDVWIGSDDAGFFRWNRKDNSFKTFGNHLTPGQTYFNTHALLQDGDKLFIGMYMGGLDIYDLKTGTFRNHKGGQHPNTLYSSSIYAIFKDSRGAIWIGTTRGLNRYRPETDDFERVFEVNHADVEYIFEDQAGFVYACSLDQGLYRLDPDKNVWEQFLISDNKDLPSPGFTVSNVVTGAEDNSGRIWVGTDGWGLFRFEPEKKCFIREPLPQSLRVVNKIIPVDDRLWITAPNGLYCYSPDSGKIQTFNKLSGLQDNLFMPNSGICLDDGSILIGGINGFNEFKPSDFDFTSKNPDVIITDLTLFNRRAAVDADDSPLTCSLAYSDRLTLSHHYSIFSISVVIPSYVNPAQNRFLYKLEGFDPDWNEGPADGRVSYTNLPTGDYRFRVKASDGAGGWNDDSLSFPIKVLPPWWLSLPMMVVYALTFIFGVYALFLRLKRKQKLELQTMEARKDKELYQSKIVFFTHMVHEIRTPLTLILTPLETVMKSKRLVSEELPTLNVIARNGRRLLDIVNKLMDFRKIESGRMDINLHPVDVRQLAVETYRNILPMAEAKGIGLDLKVPEGLCMAMADDEALRHVIENLLSNALKFTSSHIWIEICDDDAGAWCMTVRDNGRGIPEEEREKIFAPFYQVAGSQPQDNIGTGIGLLLVKKYMELMHGTLRLESSVGKGSSFSVSLPMTEEKVTVAEEKVSVEPGLTPEAGNQSDSPDKDRLLIVEDNDDLLTFLRNLFSGIYEVGCASNGRQALEMLAATPYDIVLSDVMMPEMDGMELCRRIKTSLSTSHIPVVLLTARVESDDYIEGFENGADLYVSKPFSSDVLKAQVKGILKIRRQLRLDFGKNPQIPVRDLVPDSKMDNELLAKIERIVMDHISEEDFNVDLLAQEIGISRTGLFTKLKAVAGMTPNALVKRIKLNEAARLLSEEDCRISEACYRVGFVSRSHFAKYFQEQFGVSPAEYKASPAR